METEPDANHMEPGFVVPQNLREAVEDIEIRFLLILSDHEIKSADRLLFQLEQAWWYYEDFLADKYEHLPHFRKFPQFANMMFTSSSLLAPVRDQFDAMWNEFHSYRNSIPVYGAVLLNKDMDKVVLVSSYNNSKSQFTFPKGKVNEGETPMECALRETLEETGYDVEKVLAKQKADGIAEDDSNAVRVNEKDKLEYYSNQGKTTHLYIIQNVPEDIDFEPLVRKEIGQIKWFPIVKLGDSSNHGETGDRRFWLVNVFISNLRRWIKRQKLKEVAGKMKSKPVVRNAVNAKAPPEESETKFPTEERHIFDNVATTNKESANISPPNKMQFEFQLDVEKVLEAMRPYLPNVTIKAEDIVLY